MKRHSPTTVIGVRIEDGLLTRIDDVVHADKKYKDRSQFLAAALREKLVKDFQDSELQAMAMQKMSRDIHSLDDKLSTFIELFGEFLFAFFMSSAPLPLDDKKTACGHRNPRQEAIRGFPGKLHRQDEEGSHWASFQAHRRPDRGARRKQ